MQSRLLIVDDDRDMREALGNLLSDEGHACELAEDAAAALDIVDAQTFDVVICDVRMQGMSGLELLDRLRRSHPALPFIVITGAGGVHQAVDAIKRGAFEYMVKPCDGTELRRVVTEALDGRRHPSESMRAPPPASTVGRVELVGSGPAMRTLQTTVDFVARSSAPVLVVGETGVGKELVAAAIHERSSRKRGRFVAQNLAALPPELMTSELFGHVKGAFTGAQASRRGLFELADGGTLFLDEIGEAPPSLQAMLLRALESREIWPVGGSDPRHVDLRIIAATNRDLLADAQAGSFRLDLYYRLAVAPIHIPPLRVRPEDVRGLGQPMLEAASRRMNRAQPRVIDSAWRALEQHAWPGNVRELSNVMERLVIYHAGHEVDVEELGLPAPLPGSAPSGTVRLGTPAEVPPAPVSSVSLSAAPASTAGTNPWSIVLEMPEVGTTFDDLEKEILAQVLARADGNQSRAARSLGLSESTLRSRLKRLGLKGGAT